MSIWQTYDKPWTADPIRPVPGLGWWGTGPGGGWGDAPASVPSWATWMGGRATGAGNVTPPPMSAYGGGATPMYSGMLGPGAAPGTRDVNVQGSGGTVGSAISGLLTPGLVPDIARQSAEASAGRGVPGSPAGASTAVRMSEQNYLQRLGLANTLLSGEAERNLPYQITPYQQAMLELERQRIAQQGPLRISQTRGLGGIGGGGGGGGVTGWGLPSAPYAAPSLPLGRGNFGSGPFGSDLSASMLMGRGGQGGGYPTTLDDVYEWLGLGNMGSLPGDESYPVGEDFPEWDY